MSASGTLDEIADATLDRIAAFMGQCAQEGTFCGLGVDEKKDEVGRVLYLRLVPCDAINGAEVRRWPRD